MFIKDMLNEEVQNSLQIKQDYERVLAELPRGSLVRKEIGGRLWWYCFRYHVVSPLPPPPARYAMRRVRLGSANVEARPEETGHDYPKLRARALIMDTISPRADHSASIPRRS